MKPTTVGMLVSLGVLGLGCRPQVGAPISQISGPNIIAVKGQPAEASPGTSVNYEVLAVGESGRIPAPDGDITSPVLWSICDQPKPPIETNSVSSACLDTDALPGVAGPTATTYAALMPAAACLEFGPLTPPVAEGQPPIRPRDPDVTDGYYLPVRVSLEIPEALRRTGMATADTLMAFGLERISCGLANAPSDAGREFTKNYTLNVNPVIAGLTWQQGGSAPADFPSLDDSGAAIQVQQGQTVTFSLSWTPESVETYPVFDVLSRAIVYHREALRVAWYATDGSFEHDVSGRTETDTEVFAANTWKPDVPGRVHLWVVLHDSRGGVDFAAYDLDVL